MKIGKYDLHIIESGFFGLDGGAMFGIIPKPLWEKFNPADQKNRIKLSTRNLLLKSDSKNILIDTGMGNKWDDKSKEIYQIDQNEYSLENSLFKMNLKPADITDIILTHLHFDHTGGSTKISEGKLSPSFPNAVYHVSRKNFDWAMNPTERDKGSYLKENFLPLKESGVICYSNSGKNIDDEIELIEVNGHTFGQQLVKIEDASRTLLFCGDLFPTTTHISLPYIMGYDLQPLVTLEEKKKILETAAEGDWELFFEHDPLNALASVERSEKGYKIKEKYKSFE
ncbi:MAG TPA: MBL fold metallo-hydrolase [Ignavibacteriaceae bacterium]|nr:MBL fold metallo-hydrolase [Ignavibacteriaceae bacterium]